MIYQSHLRITYTTPRQSTLTHGENKLPPVARLRAGGLVTGDAPPTVPDARSDRRARRHQSRRLRIPEASPYNGTIYPATVPKLGERSDAVGLSGQTSLAYRSMDRDEPAVLRERGRGGEEWYITRRAVVRWVAVRMVWNKGSYCR